MSTPCRCVSIRTKQDTHSICSEFGGSRPLNRILTLVERSGCRTVVVHEGHSEEWDAEYREFYRRVTKIAKEVQRLDFFAAELSEAKEVQTLSDDLYLGYAIIRPDPLNSIVESIVPPPKDRPGSYLLCGVSCEVKVEIPSASVSRTFPVRGVPFCQKDGSVGVCAHAAFRIASMILNMEYPGCRALTFPEMTESVRGMVPDVFKGRHLPSTGLYPNQLVKLCDDIGAPAIAYNLRDKKRGDVPEPARLVYSAVEARLPVILNVETERYQHALVVVGHTFDSDSWWSEAQPAYYPSLGEKENGEKEKITWMSSGMWASDFLIMDDNYGAYLSMSRESLQSIAAYAIIPYPDEVGIFLSSTEAEYAAAVAVHNELVLEQVLDEQNTCQWKKEFLQKDKKKASLVLRGIFLETDSFRKSIEQSASPRLVKQAYRTVCLPDHIWLFEVSTPGLYPRGLKIGEIIVDPHVSCDIIASAPDRAVQTIHLAGLFSDLTQPGADPTPIFISDDEPLNVLVRPDFATS